MSDDNIQVISQDKNVESPEPKEPVETEAEIVDPESADDEHDETTDDVDEESDTSDDDSDSDDDESKDKGDKKPKRKSGFKKRIERFQRRLSEKEQEIEYWRQVALKDKKSDEPEAKQESQSHQTGEEKPDPDDYETQEDFIDALTDWKIEQREAKRLAKEREQSQKTAYQQQVEGFQSKVKDFSKSVDDFEDVISDVDDIPLTPGLQEALLTSELGPQVMYELARDRDVLERVNGLTPLQQAREIGKIEARLTSDSPHKETRKTSTAPPPIKPVGGRSARATRRSIYDKGLSQAEYEKLRREGLRS